MRGARTGLRKYTTLCGFNEPSWPLSTPARAPSPAFGREFSARSTRICRESQADFKWNDRRASASSKLALRLQCSLAERVDWGAREGTRARMATCGVTQAEIARRQRRRSRSGDSTMQMRNKQQARVLVVHYNAQWRKSCSEDVEDVRCGNAGRNAQSSPQREKPRVVTSARCLNRRHRCLLAEHRRHLRRPEEERSCMSERQSWRGVQQSELRLYRRAGCRERTQSNQTASQKRSVQWRGWARAPPVVRWVRSAEVRPLLREWVEVRVCLAVGLLPMCLRQ